MFDCFRFTERRLRADTDLMVNRPVLDPNPNDTWHAGAIICSFLYNHSSRSELPFTVTVAAAGSRLRCSNSHFHYFCLVLIEISNIKELKIMKKERQKEKEEEQINDEMKLICEHDQEERRRIKKRLKSEQREINILLFLIN